MSLNGINLEWKIIGGETLKKGRGFFKIECGLFEVKTLGFLHFRV